MSLPQDTRQMLGFTGHEMESTTDFVDLETGLINMGGRIYDPSIAKFTSANPLEFTTITITQDLNAYSYVWNNPLSLTDPSGYQPDTTYNPGDIIPSEDGPMVVDEKGGIGYVMDPIVIKAEPMPLEFPSFDSVIPSSSVAPQDISVFGTRPEVMSEQEITNEINNIALMSSFLPLLGDHFATLLGLMILAREPNYDNISNSALDLVGAALPLVPALGAARRAKSYMKGRSVAPIDKTMEQALDPNLYVKDIIDKYGINMKGSGHEVSFSVEKMKSSGTMGVTRLDDFEKGKFKIIIGRDVVSSGNEAMIANTIAHELIDLRAKWQSRTRC